MELLLIFYPRLTRALLRKFQWFPRFLFIPCANHSITRGCRKPYLRVGKSKTLFTMKNILFLTVALCCVLYSCSSPEKKAKKIVGKFQTSLEQIVSDAPNLNAYELSKQIQASKATFDLEVSDASCLVLK